MSLLRRISLIITILIVGTIAAYLFVWFLLLMAVLIPAGVIWLRWKMRRAKTPKARIRISTPDNQ
jgi:Flp pilus assembly protein TadB